MIEMLQRLRTRQRSRNGGRNVFNNTRTNQYTLNFDELVDKTLVPANERPLFVAHNINEGSQVKRVGLRARWNYRVVSHRPSVVVTVKQTIGGVEETIYIPVEEDHSPSFVCPSQPPRNAEIILHLFLKRGERDAVIGDLLERYSGKYERFGERRAKIWFYGEVVRSIWPLLKRLVARASGLIALGEWIRRHVS